MEAPCPIRLRAASQSILLGRCDSGFVWETDAHPWRQWSRAIFRPAPFGWARPRATRHSGIRRAGNPRSRDSARSRLIHLCQSTSAAPSTDLTFVSARDESPSSRPGCGSEPAQCCTTVTLGSCAGGKLRALTSGVAVCCSALLEGRQSLNRGAMSELIRNTLTAFLLSLILASPFASEAARASGADSAESLIAEGVELRRVGQDAEALSKFEKAYQLTPTPRAAAQLGLCLQAIGRWSEAEAKLSEALKAREDRWVQKNRDVLRESLEAVKANVARVEVNGGPDGAVVTINGREIGTFPLAQAVVVNAGAADIEVTKPGFVRGFRSLNLTGGQYQRVVIRLEEARDLTAAAPGPTPVSLAVNPEPGGAEEAGALGERADKPAKGPFYRRAWFWGAVGAAVVAGALAVALGGGGEAPGPTVDEKGVYQLGAAP